MTSVPSLRSIPSTTLWKKGDILVLFGELFSRGYANGLVEAAEKRGMKIIRGTVGRRDKDGFLRPLNAEELATQTQPLINLPLEAGFDMEILSQGQSLLDLMKDVKLNDWQSFKVSYELIAEAKQKGRHRFQKQVRHYLEALSSEIPSGANVHFAHLMAGGVPRARILMPLMNKVFKGTGDRFLESEIFWKSGLGQVTEASFMSVSAETYEILIQESETLRHRIESHGGSVSYSAYGYHGTEVLIDDAYQWQSYAPYLQGWAKIELEKIAVAAFERGIKACVYNCPEILTNSSSIFQGVEVPLYPLLAALKKEGPTHARTQQIWQECQALLKPGITLEDILAICAATLKNPLIQSQAVFAKWPQHNTKEQMEALLGASDQIIGHHLSDKALMTAVLSESVFAACGEAMLSDMAKPTRPVQWINHDLVAKHTLQKN